MWTSVELFERTTRQEEAGDPGAGGRMHVSSTGYLAFTPPRTLATRLDLRVEGPPLCRGVVKADRTTTYHQHDNCGTVTAPADGGLGSDDWGQSTVLAGLGTVTATSA